MIRSGISKCFIKVWLKRLSSAAVADTSREIQSPSANIWIENPTKLTAEQRKSLAKGSKRRDEMIALFPNFGLTDLVVKENFITLKEEENLLAEVSSHLKRLRYEKDHWDDVCFHLLIFNGCWILYVFLSGDSRF